MNEEMISQVVSMQMEESIFWSIAGSIAVCLLLLLPFVKLSTIRIFWEQFDEDFFKVVKIILAICLVISSIVTASSLHDVHLCRRYPQAVFFHHLTHANKCRSDDSGTTLMMQNALLNQQLMSQ